MGARLMSANGRNEGRGFTVLELLITIVLIGILVGALVAMMGPFGHRRRLETSAVKLTGDLRQVQQFSRVQRDGYRYYGLRFYDAIGEDDDGDGTPDREGWKIVRYEPINLTLPVDFNNTTAIKSSESTDDPEFLEDTFFGERVTIDGSSEFQISPDPPELHSIVFTPEGSATIDGNLTNLLTASNDTIILSGYGNNITIQITPLTGHIGIE